MFDKFAIFICTNGRPNRQTTFRYLREQGYTGQIYFVLDNMDSTVQDYINYYGADNIWIFNKQYYMDNTDTGFINPPSKAIVYVKNAVEDIASKLNLNSFVMADDDLTSFRIRYVVNNRLISYNITNLDEIINQYNSYMLSGDFVSLAFCGNVQYMAGVSVFDNVQNFRTLYNFVFRNCKYKVNWKGLFAEDITTSVLLGCTGYKMLSVPFVQFDTPTPGGASSGGMNEAYSSIDISRQGLNVLMYNPSKIKLNNIRGKIKACIIKDKAYPKIISAKYKQEV